MKNAASETTMISPVAGLFYGQTFFDEAEAYLQDTTSDTCNMMAVDIEHFRLYNKIHGREEGDILLQMVAEVLKKFQEKHGGIVGYLGGDNFAVLSVCDQEELGLLRRDVRHIIKERSDTIGYLPAFGIYHIVDKNIPTMTMYDHATVALAHVLGNYTKRSCEYNSDMDDMESKTYDAMSSIEVEIDELTDKQRAHIEKYYGNLPGGYGIGKVLLDEDGKPVDYEIAYANKELSRLSGGSVERLRYMMTRIFVDRQEEFIEKAYQAAYLGKRVEMHVYSKITSRYLDITMYQYQYGYASCMLQDVTHNHIYEKALGNVMLSFREVYFLHLQDNYCRMIYPDDNHMLERGNYEEVVNRHFSTGKILPQGEDGIRKFLSLENLKRVLKKQDEVEYKYKRSIKPSGEEWCLTTVSVAERQADGTPKTATITIRSIEALMREKEDHKRQNMAAMMRNMSDGFLVYEAREGERLLYANPPVLKMFGRDSMEEFCELVHDSFRGMVYPEDLKRVEWEIREQVKHSDANMDYIRYRIMRKDGEIRWIDDCGHLEDAEAGGADKLFYVFVSDITDTLPEEQKQRLMNQSKHFNEYPVSK